MTDVTPVNALLADITTHQYNPAGIQRAVLQCLADASNGELEIVDPTNPFVFALESAAVLTAGFMMKNEASTRKQYAVLSQEEDDLYRHMSDKDFSNRFALPAPTQFSILFQLDEILNNLVLDPVTGIKKLVIPRNTFFTVAELTFSLQYPIEIRQLQHGGLQVVYDAEIVSPLQSLATNVINHEIRRTTDADWLFFTVDVQQFNIISQTGAMNSAVDFNLDVAFEDQYYYARVYADDGSGGWNEIKTTHTDQVYDPLTPTAVLKVTHKSVNVRIPQIYSTLQLLNRMIRIDVYQTKGPLNLILWEYPFSAYTVSWLALNKQENNEYVAPMKVLKNVVVFSDKAVNGGRDALGFEALRERVIQGAIGTPKVPITNIQIEQALIDKGYQVVKNIDTITNRVFLATKGMPKPINTKLITAAGASIQTLLLSITDTVTRDSVHDNGDSITINPETLYQNTDGITKIVSSEQVAYLLSLPPDRLAEMVTGKGYLYTPFHYVLDMSGNSFDLRPYYLDDPEVETKLFVAENDTTLIQVNTGLYSLSRSESGYSLQLITQSSDAYKLLDDSTVYTQLAYTPFGERDKAYLNGVLIGKTDDGERIFSFDLGTNFNVDKNNSLFLTAFKMYTTADRLTGASLDTVFDVLYSTSEPMGTQWVPGRIDAALGTFLLPGRIAGITHEQLKVRFGYALKTLWARARSIVSSIPYQKHEVDVPSLYEKDVYERDVNGAATISFDGNGRPVFNKLHSAGDPVLDGDGFPVLKHRKGDVVFDALGHPIPVNSRGLIRQVDLMLIEGVYRFATDAVSVKYREDLTRSVVDSLMNDLAEITPSLLDLTRIYYYPKSTTGLINVMVGEGFTKTLDAGQSFNVNLYVTEPVYMDMALRERLEQTTVKIISEELLKTTITIDSITELLRKNYSTDVIAVELMGLGGEMNYPALTVLDDSERCSVRKRLTALSDNSLIVEEDITISFIRHQIKK